MFDRRSIVFLESRFFVRCVVSHCVCDVLERQDVVEMASDTEVIDIR